MSRLLVLALASAPLSQASETRPAPATRAACATAPEGVSDSDWAGIRAAYEAGRHAVFGVEDEHCARNPGQGWTTHFDGRGFTTQPDGGGWTWGLDLVRFGFEDDEREVAGQACTSTSGQRIAYAWSDSFEEWYVNDGRGLKHGYTLSERPQGAGTLSLTLRVRGALRADVQPDGLGVRFVDCAGASVLTYAGLTVLDADGRALPAGIEPAPEGLRILVDERGARYPLTIDPLAQQAYLKASNTNAGDVFGYSVAISGDTAVVGAYEEDSNATGVNGNQADNSAGSAGAVYVFVRSGSAWSQQAYLKASNTGAGDGFGWSVAISGDTAVVGARLEDSNAAGVNGNEADNSVGDAGAVYVFVRSGTTWSQQAYLKASNTGAGDVFGWSVAISGDTAVVGATFEDSKATGVNGNEGNNSENDAGAAYVFVRSGTTWSQQAYLKASNTGAGDHFGISVAISDDTAVVGANLEDSNATGVNGNQADNSAVAAGAAYVFVRSGSTWSQQAYLKASNTGASDSFGFSVAISGDTVVVGAANESSNATGVNGNEGNNSENAAGAAYGFVRRGSTWSQQAYLKASNTHSVDSFGYSVAISGDTAVVGAGGEDSNATGVNGNQANNSVSDAGAAYVFVRSGTTWSQQAYLKASNTNAGDVFGYSVAISGDTAVVGAVSEDSNATGVNGNQANNSASGAGAAYVFLLRPDPVPYCFGDGSGTPCPCTPVPLAGDADKGCPNTFNAGGGKIAASGESRISADTLVLSCTLINNGGAVVFQGTNDNGGGLGTPFGDGLRCAAGTVMRMKSHAVTTNVHQYPDPMFADNAISIRGAVTMPGVRYYQGWYRSQLAHCNPTDNYNLTNGLRITWVL